MLISFFEEFPTKQNLAKLQLVTWPTKLYLAAPSLQEFKKVVRGVKIKRLKTRGTRNTPITEFIYWPILQKEEGYWISPFSKKPALNRIFQELAGKNAPVMLDLELPTTRNPWLYLTQAPNFIINKNLIKNFLHQYRGDLYLAEYYPEGKRKERVLQWLGLHYSHPKAKIKIIKMLYHSMHSFKEEFVEQELSRGKKEYGKNFLVAYGTIGTGIQQTEPNILVEQLELDLKLAQQAGIREVVLYRLGGLNQGYAKVLRKYAKR